MNLTQVETCVAVTDSDFFFILSPLYDTDDVTEWQDWLGGILKQEQAKV